MLTSVPQAINQSSRQVVLRHPNSQDVTVYRKVIKRVETEPSTGDPSEMGGYPTQGGMGILSAEDEADFEYIARGPGRMMSVGGQFAAQEMIRRDNGLVAEAQREVLIEAVADPGKPGYFVADSSDLVCVIIGPGVVLAFEVVDVVGDVNIPPYTRRLVLNPRDDLDYVEPFSE